MGRGLGAHGYCWDLGAHGYCCCCSSWCSRFDLACGLCVQPAPPPPYTPTLGNDSFVVLGRWLLYLDDDTMVFLPAMVRLLSGLEAESPLAFTADLW